MGGLITVNADLKPEHNEMQPAMMNSSMFAVENRSCDALNNLDE